MQRIWLPTLYFRLSSFCNYDTFICKILQTISFASAHWGQATPPQSCKRQASQSRIAPSLYPKPSMPYLWAWLCVSFWTAEPHALPPLRLASSFGVFIEHDGRPTSAFSIFFTCVLSTFLVSFMMQQQKSSNLCLASGYYRPLQLACTMKS